MLEYRLVVVAGPLMGQSFEFPRGETLTIGRSSSADIQLQGTLVSRQHAELGWSKDTPTVTDLGSRNGTAVNMRPIAAKTPIGLKEDQVIKIGKHALLVDGVRSSSEESSDLVLFDAPRLSKRYQLKDRIGRGSQATVWSAWDTKRERKVAIKVLRGVATQGAEDQERFLREGKICCRLDDPHLVRVYEFGVPRGEAPYMVMEFVEGTNAWSLCRKRCLPIQEALTLGIHLARALAAIGEVGIVHRDVKPTNLLVTNEGLGKLTDFGIAKVIGGPTLTETGWGMGSLPFAAPEQAANAKQADVRADVYGLGATLYALLASKPPFEGNPNTSGGLRKLLKAIENDPPAPLAPLRPDMPATLGEFVERVLLAKSPDERPQTAAEALTGLEAIYQPLYEESGEPAKDESGRHSLDRTTARRRPGS